MNVEKDMVMEFALEKSDIEPKVPEEEPTMSEALGEVPTDSKVLKTTKLDPSLEGIDLATKHEAQQLSTKHAAEHAPEEPSCSSNPPRPAKGGEDHTTSWLQAHMVGGRPTPPRQNPRGGLADTFNPETQNLGALPGGARQASVHASTQTRASGGDQEETGSHRPPSLPPVGAKFCRAAEGGGDFQVDPSPCLSPTRTNP